jgi:alpha-beta hydrolase superfamily lysophospholipase
MQPVSPVGRAAFLLVSPIRYMRPGLPVIIIMHGDEDDIVPYSQAVRLHKALDSLALPDQLVTIHGAKHDGFNKETPVRIFAAIRAFLQKQRISRKDNV